MKATFGLCKRNRRVVYTVGWRPSWVLTIPCRCLVMGIEALVDFENGSESPVLFHHWSIGILSQLCHIDHNVPYTSMGSKIPSMTESANRRIFTLKIWFSSERSIDVRRKLVFTDSFTPSLASNKRSIGAKIDAHSVPFLPCQAGFHGSMIAQVESFSIILR